MGNTGLSGQLKTYDLYVSVQDTSGTVAGEYFVDSFSVQWGPVDNCLSTYFGPPLTTITFDVVYFKTGEQSLDIMIPNYEATLQSNPTACGNRVTSYVSSNLVNTETWVFVAETSLDFYTFRLTPPPYVVPLNSANSFIITSTLANYPEVPSQDITVIVTFICPSAPSMTAGAAATVVNFNYVVGSGV